MLHNVSNEDLQPGLVVVAVGMVWDCTNRRVCHSPQPSCRHCLQLAVERDSGK
jgi:hypothetical protein